MVEWVRAKLSPMIWSLGWRPRLILPRDLWKSLDERQRSTLVVHELAHLRRGDHLLRFFELFVTALFWWHPLVWWVRLALRDAEEQCCDAWVVWAFPDATRSYAETLLETIEFLNHTQGSEPLLASGFGKVHHLRRRLTMILSGTTPRLLGIRGALGLLGLAVMLLPLNATWAQKPEKSENVEVLASSSEDLKLVADPNAAAGSLLVMLQAGDDDKSEVHVVVKIEDSEIRVSGKTLDEAIDQLKKRIAEIGKTSPPSEQQLKALELAVKGLPRPQGRSSMLLRNKPGRDTASDVKRVMIVRRTEDSPKKPLSDEHKAAAEKLRARVKMLTGELELKAKELAEVKAKLAELEGTHVGASRVVVRPVRVTDVKAGAAIKEIDVRPEHVVAAPFTGVVLKRVRQIDGKNVVVLEPRETPRTQEKTPTSGEIKRVNPSKRRVEITIGSDDGLVPGHELELKKASPVKLGTVTLPVRSEQQRIEALERTLKKLIGEVDRLKKERENSPEKR